jgi:tetratricopeptide (TPR) repeat protein
MTTRHVVVTECQGGMETEQLHTRSIEISPDSSASARIPPAEVGIRASVRDDVNGGTFFEAEHNLRAIHDMAAEHLAHGEYAEAIEVFEEILRGQHERYGPIHFRVGTALHNLGIVHLKSGDYEKAIEICSQAVKVRREALVPNHPDVAVSLAQLAVAHLECQQFEYALAAFHEALHIRRTQLGPKHPKCSKILNNIGCAMYSLDKLEGSRLAFEEALEIQRETLRMGPSAEHGQEFQSTHVMLSIASTLCNIGSIRLRWGQLDDACVALDEALLVRCLCTSLGTLQASLTLFPS